MTIKTIKFDSENKINNAIDTLGKTHWCFSKTYLTEIDTKKITIVTLNIFQRFINCFVNRFGVKTWKANDLQVLYKTAQDEDIDDKQKAVLKKVDMIAQKVLTTTEYSKLHCTHKPKPFCQKLEKCSLIGKRLLLMKIYNQLAHVENNGYQINGSEGFIYQLPDINYQQKQM